MIAGRNIIKQMLSYLLIASFSVMFLCKVFYMHTHILADGRILVHWHYYDKTASSGSIPVQSHTHSSSDVIFYSLLNQLFFSDKTLAIFLSVVAAYHFIHFYVGHSRTNKCIRKGRAPPVVISTI